MNITSFSNRRDADEGAERAPALNGAGARIVPVLLSGGAGTRLWPLSRELHPKQLLPLCSERSMLLDTAARVGDAERFAPPLVICNHEHRFIIAEQMRQSGLETAGIVLEPAARNTAPACAVAALLIAQIDPDLLMLVLPADHLVRDAAAFQRAVEAGAAAAREGRLVTFGIAPTGPETGYGYIRRGAALAGLPGVEDVAQFVEKPELALAKRFVDDGGYLWNSGMFVFSAGRFLEELEVHAPETLAGARAALVGAGKDLEFTRLDQEAFAACPSISIDYAVMERTDRAAVVPCDLGWTDVGAWSALWEVGDKDARGNVVIGDVVIEDASNSYVRSENRLTAVVGLDDAVVVVTDDVVLAASRDRVQDIKRVVERLKADGRSEVSLHRKVHRPWGAYQGLHAGARFQVKCLTIAPGARISLQQHHHRAEHWVVVEGAALVTRGDEQLYVYENQSVYIPMGTVHRLENPGKLPLIIIEVQSGSYLGEDDIVRLEDSYGRI